MKKFYSIVLMAAALLVGTNAQATTLQEIQDAIDNAAVGATVNITLNSDVTGITTPIQIYANKAEAGKTVNLNLAGHTISAGAKGAVIELFKGTLNLEGPGTISTDKNYEAIRVYGAFEDEANWSILNIGDGVNVTSDAPAGTAAKDLAANAISIIEFYPNRCTYVNPTYAGLELTYMDPNDYKVAKYVSGTSVKNATISTGHALFTSGKIDYVPCEIKAGETVTEKTVKGTTYSWVTATTKCAAFGAKIEVLSGAKVRGDKYGIKINGNIKTMGENLPYVHIANGAEVSAAPETPQATAVYSSGYGKFVIEGEVHGSTGVYVKGGEVTVKDGAEIYSDYEGHTDLEGKGSGINAGGSAIVYESNVNYVGNITINVEGGTIGSEDGGGYAIEGFNSKPSQADQELQNLNIQGGTIVAGDMGALETEALQSAIEQGATFVINGATIETDNADMQDLNNLLELAGNTTLIVQTDEGQYVFEKAPADVEVKENVNLSTTTEKYIELEGSEQVLSNDVDVTYLALKSNANGDISSITIPAGITLKAGSIVMDKDAVIDVQLGGKLIITDENGLVANQTSNIKIAAKEGQMGIFMLSPKAKANKNPSATVTLETKAHKEGSTYVYQRIGVPAADGMTTGEMTANPSSAGIALAYWDGATQGWTWVPNKTFVIQPFWGLALTNNATAEGTKYSMPCRLMGNTDANLTLVGAWTSFANSYMANVDMFELVSDIKDAGEGASATVYVYDAVNDYWPTITWYNLNKWKNGQGDKPLYTELEPLQGFIFNNTLDNTNAQAIISYEKEVWDPVFDPEHNVDNKNNIAARRAASVNNNTDVQITITTENGQHSEFSLTQGEDFSEAFDNGVDAKALLGLNPVNIYATNEFGAWAALASDNVIGTKLSVETKDQTSFTMTFSNLNGEQLAIRDNLTGSVIEMKEGATYCFTVAANSVSERFEIVTPKYAPTDVETIITNEGVKAVYTILGQYVGTTDNWNILPAGIYVVEGVKMVK